MLYPQTMEPTAGTQWKGGTEGLKSSTTLASSADVVAAVLGGPAFARNRLVSNHAAAAVLSSDLEPLDVVAGHSALGALRPTEDEDTEDSVVDISAQFNVRHLTHVEADASSARHTESIRCLIQPAGRPRKLQARV